MTDYQCTCYSEFSGNYKNNLCSEGCPLNDPKLKGYLMVCQRLDKLIEVLTPKQHD